jgi:TetR/AcrR family transcriptional regulator, transcriptional repressor for nem operon
MVENFTAWTGAIRTCLEQAGDRLPPTLDRQAAAEFTLTVMEGGVMQARTFRDVGYFDRAVDQLRQYFQILMKEGATA